MLAASMAAEAAPYRQAPATAPNLSYDYVEGRVLLLDPDEGDDGEGVRLGGSMLITPEWFVAGGLTHVSFDGADVDQIDPSLGWRHALDSRMDFVAYGSLLWTDRECGGNCDDDDIGLGLTGGIRAALAPQVEVGGYVGYSKVFDEGTVTLTGEGLYHVTRQLSLVAALTLSDDLNGLGLGARWNF